MRRAIIGKSKGDGYGGGGFEMQIITSTSNQVFTLPGRSGYTYNATVYWGDGSNSTITTFNDSDLAHTYATAGTYQVSITGTFDTIYFNGTGSKLLVSKILSWGGANFNGFTIMENSYLGCSNLNELATGGVKQRTAITTYSGCWFSCTSLTALPTDLLRYNTSVTNFNNCFRSAGLTTIPADLFRYNSAVTVYTSCFQNCSGLTLRNDMFDFANFLNKSINWTNFVNRVSFTGTQGTMQDIWNADYGLGTPNLGTSTTRPFYGAGNSTTSISNYNDIPTGWKA